LARNHAFDADVAKKRRVISSGIFCRELIGRSSELAFLLERVRATSGRASVVIVVRGEAGIGKTRLVDEVTRAVRGDGYRTALGSTREYANAPYAALEEAFERLGIDVVRTLEDGAADAKTRRFNAIAEAIAAAAATGTSRGLLIVVEDLHWADVGTLELLRFLASRLAECGVTFIVTYRPDEIESDSARARSIVALEREAEAVVTLDALPSTQIERLLASVIRDGERSVSADVLAQIRDLSDGRPLFAEELLRGVFERLDRDIRAEPSVPTSVRVTVRERFASLTDTDRTVLLHAALIGRRFSARFVASFSGNDLFAVYAALRRARDLQLVVEQPDDEGDAFAFRHALTREAVYSELLRAEARLMHGKVAQALAAEPTPDVAAIADHLWRAGEAEAAADWSERAGDDAYGVYAYADAARAYERSHRLAVDEARRAHLAERTADSWYALGDLAQSVDWFGRAAEAYDAAHEPRPAWRLALRKARVLFESGRYEAGLREADHLATTVGVEPELRFEAEVMVAGLLTTHGRAVEALERLQRAERLGVRSDPFVNARFSGAYALALGFIGRPDEARPRFQTAVDEARALADNDLMLRTYNNWGNLEIAYGTLSRARELYAEALGGAEKTKNRHIAAWIAQNAALPALLSGDLAQARELVARSAQIEHGVRAVRRWSLALSMRLGTLEGSHGADELDRAGAALDEAIDDVDLSSIAMLAASIAHRLAAQHRISEAGNVIARVLPVFEHTEAPYWLVDAASRYGDATARARAREFVAAVAARESARAAQGVLALMDARDALRHRRRDECIALAERAVDAFRAAGWTLEQAYALELAGRVADAVALFRRIGATAEVRRNTETGVTAARRRGESTLTGREREIAGLLVAGHQTRAIAETLVISERTVETHIAAIYRKLGVSNRRALETLLAESAAT
jgi:DNA-binding CsgD family transcriptional regulator/tetratricopeptide (TPR) repeat protein